MSPDAPRQPIFEGITYDREESSKDAEAWTWAQVLAGERGEFEPLAQAGQGITTDVAWVRFSIRNETGAPVRRVLELGRTNTAEEVDLRVTRSDGRTERWVMGELHPISNMRFAWKQVSVPLELAPGEQVRVMYRFFKYGDQMLIGPVLWKTDAFLAHVSEQTSLGSLFYGLLAVMMLYHLLLYAAIRDISYLHYVGALASVLLLDLGTAGALKTWFFPNTAVDTNPFFYAAILFMTMTWSQFTRSALNTCEYAPRIGVALRWVAICAGTLALLTVFWGGMPVGMRAGTAFGLNSVMLVVCIAAGVVCMRGGFQPAKLYLGAYACLFAGLGLFLVYLNVKVKLPPVVDLYSGQLPRVGIAGQVTLFGLVLARRINVLGDQVAQAQEDLLGEQQERLAAQGRALEVEREAAATLQKKVDERTLELRERNLDLARVNNDLSQLFNNMRQGVLAFDSQGTVLGRASRQAQLIFGEEHLQGKKVDDLLFAGADAMDISSQELAWWREILFTSGIEGWPEFEKGAPDEVVLGGEEGPQRYLKLEYQPIVEKDQLALVMMLVTDRTEQVLLERAAVEREEVYARQMEKMRRMTVGGGQLFVDFLRNGRQRLSEIDAVLDGGGGRCGAADVEFMFRHAHTVKGEARSFDLDALESACHGLEEQLQTLRSAASASGSVDLSASGEDLRAAIEASRASLDEARDHLIEASPIGASILEQITVQRDDVRELQSCVEEMRARGLQLHPSLGAVAQRLASRPMGESVSGIADNLDRWARGTGKRVQLHVEGKDCLVPPALARVLSAALTHLIRNAVDHAIELPDEREALGKDELGTILVQGFAGSHGPTLRISDDGRGIDLANLREKAESEGVAYTAGQEVELIFVDGMSTSAEVGDLSGRGVGMSAVKAELAEVGYSIHTETEAGKGTTFTLRSVEATGQTESPEPLPAAS